VRVGGGMGLMGVREGSVGEDVEQGWEGNVRSISGRGGGGGRCGARGGRRVGKGGAGGEERRGGGGASGGERERGRDGGEIIELRGRDEGEKERGLGNGGR